MTCEREVRKEWNGDVAICGGELEEKGPLVTSVDGEKSTGTIVVNNAKIYQCSQCKDVSVKWG